MSVTDPLADGVAWIDGEYVPVRQACLPILDWGLTRSDATYDVVHTWQGRFFRLDDHIQRFIDSMRRLRLDPGLDRDDISQILHGCVAASGFRDSYVEMICTRGVPPAGSRDPRHAVNRFFAFAIPFVWIANEGQRRRGLAAVTSRKVRRIPADAVDPRDKNFHWLDFVVGLLEAYDRDADTVILTDGAGNVTEGPGFNVFAVSDGAIHTPEAGVLLGVTRRTVLELADEIGVTTRTSPLPESRLGEADEIFLTSTAGGVMPVTSLDGRPVGDGTVGQITRRIQDAYWEAHNREAWSTPIRPTSAPVVRRDGV